MVYGTTWKELIQEEFGDGIMSAIDFDMSLERQPDQKGDRVKITMSGKFLPYKRTEGANDCDPAPAKLCTRLPDTRRQPSTMTKKISLNGSDTSARRQHHHAEASSARSATTMSIVKRHIDRTRERSPIVAEH